MANLPESPNWTDGVYQIERNDPVGGGPNGAANKPLKDLANRTRWLYEKFGTAFDDLGWMQLGAWAVGLEVSLPTQIVNYQGAWYRYRGSLDTPHIITGASPADDGGVWSGDNPDGIWVDVGDANIRSELRSNDGPALIGESVFGTLQNYLDRNALKLRYATLANLLVLNSYGGSIDPVRLLGRVVKVDFNNAASDNNSPGGGARYQIMTAASYGATPDGSTVNGLPVGADHYLAGGVTYVAKLIGDINGQLDVEMFGAYQGQATAYSTAAINSAINYAAGRPVYIPSKKFRYEGSNTSTKITLIGRKRPRVADDKGALIDGSILIGNTLFRPVFGVFVDFGVDHGVDNFPIDTSSAGDGLKISATTPTAGKSCIVTGCIGLGRRASDPTHAILVEGYAHAEVTSVRGVRNWFGLAAKFTGGFIDGVTAEDNGNYAVILKTDASFGQFRDVNISNVEIIGTPGVTSTGFEIEAVDSQQMQRVNISNLNVRNVGTAFRINASGGVINDMHVSNAFLQNISSSGIVTLGTIYNLTFNSVDVIACAGRVADLDGVRCLTINNMTGLATATNTSFATDLIRITSNATLTALANLRLLRGTYSNSEFGAVQYNNSAGQNKVSNVFATMTGGGAPT